MKAQIQILLILALMIFSCQQHEPYVELCPPSDFPEWVEDWSNWDQSAYEDGRITFNEDSSMMIVLGPRSDKDSSIYKALRNETYKIK